MVVRLIARSLKHTWKPVFTQNARPRYLTTSNAPPNAQSGTTPPRQQNWLTRQVKASPVALKYFLKVASLMGYTSPQQIAARRALYIYREICAVRADEESAFWTRDCHLPPTFQSWFTITNLHVWMLTVRLRALPNPHSQNFIQGLIDHFFIDVEDRIRAVLQPGVILPDSFAFKSEFYSIPKAIASRNIGKNDRAKAPERLVKQQMKIFKEQWTGMGMAFDLGMVKGDEELAGAVWRNLLGARGARGIVLSTDDHKVQIRRNINPGGEVEKYAKLGPEALQVAEATDDGSGVYDFGPNESDEYVKYPETMVTVVSYLRRELVRLERLDDGLIAGPLKTGKEREDLVKLRFGSVKE